MKGKLAQALPYLKLTAKILLDLLWFAIVIFGTIEFTLDRPLNGVYLELVAIMWVLFDLTQAVREKNRIYITNQVKIDLSEKELIIAFCKLLKKMGYKVTKVKK